MNVQGNDICTLVQRIARFSDENAYKKLFEIYFPSLKRFAFCIVKSHESAEEIASDAMISLWRHRTGLEAIQNIKLYLFVITKNLAVSHLRKNTGTKLQSLEEVDVHIHFNTAGPDESYITSEMKKKLQTAVQTLPPRCKMVFKLVKEEEMSYREVAELLNISVKTVDAQLLIAIRKITEAIKVVYKLY